MIVIITPEDFQTEHEVPILETIAKYDNVRIHVRKPHASADELEAFLSQLSLNCLSKISIHQHYYLSQYYAVTGIHVTSKMRLEPELWLKYIDNKKVSTSFHDFSEIVNCRYPFDYAFISPIFKSISKQNYSPVFDLDQLDCFLQTNSSSIPLIGLGGITMSNLKVLQKLKLNGAAFLGGFWNCDAKSQMLGEITSVVFN